MEEPEGERWGRPGCCEGEVEKEAIAGWASLSSCLSRLVEEEKGDGELCLRGVWSSIVKGGCSRELGAGFRRDLIEG